ncbi:MAG: zinc-binding dehydrogenase, partial [Armatimonadetes bacterium]|nr:zinc-binding dehydrogenase [Armatimonadota bacterium]NIO96131.1 zinc-binding dehydrogenase [Armatimonadota bacterium]
MKKVVLSGKSKAAVVEAADPQPKDEWVVVKVHAAPMCAEYKHFLAGKKLEAVGHEAAGEVVAVAQPGKVKVGDRVVAMPLYGCGECTLCKSGDYIHCEHAPDFAELHGTVDGKGAMAQYILKPDWLLMPIPEGISYEKASLACCALGPSFGAFGAVGLNGSDTVLITGAGPVGLGGIVNARFRGARPIVVESAPWRRERAKQLGAQYVIDPGDDNALPLIMEVTEDKGVDCAVECAGTVSAQRLCIDATRRKGKVAFVGQCHEDLRIKITPDLLWKGLSLIGVWHYNLSDYPRVMKVIQESPLIDSLISHVLPISKIQEA